MDNTIIGFSVHEIKTGRKEINDVKNEKQEHEVSYKFVNNKRGLQ